MRVIKPGDPNKIAEHNRKKDLRVFTCPVCGCVWEASFEKKEIYVPVYGDGWYSKCPMTNCDGVGMEEM